MAEATTEHGYGYPRRKLLRWAAALVILAVACAPTPEAPPPPGGASPPAAASQPPPGGSEQAPAPRQPDRGSTVIYPSNISLATPHPYKLSGIEERLTIGPAYESLVSFDWDKDYRVEFKVVPWLAESWEQPDTTTYRFRLRKGVLWHDGQPFTADDVVATYTHVAEPKNALPRRSLLSNVARAERVDELTVRVVAKEASPRLLQDLAEPSLFIAPKHVIDADGLAKVTIGTGPYRLKSLDPTKENVFERFDRYWQRPRPYPDGVRVVFGLDPSAMVAAFVAGQADLVQVPNQALAEPILRAVPKAQLKHVTIDVGIALRMHIDRPPFDDVRVRRALHLAVDRQTMWQTLTDGKGDINPPGVPGSKAGWAIPPEELAKLPGYRQPKEQDLAEARRLLAEAGQSNLKFRVLYSSAGSVPPVVIEPLVAQWRKIGVEAVADGRDGATYRQLDIDGDFETALTYTAKMNLVQYVPGLFRTGAALNKTGVNDHELDQAIDTMLTSFDGSARKAAARRMQEILLDRLYFIPTIDVLTYGLAQPWVRGLAGYPASTPFDVSNASQVWLDRELLPEKRK